MKCSKAGENQARKDSLASHYWNIISRDEHASEETIAKCRLQLEIVRDFFRRGGYRFREAWLHATESSLFAFKNCCLELLGFSIHFLLVLKNKQNVSSHTFYFFSLENTLQTLFVDFKIYTERLKSCLISSNGNSHQKFIRFVSFFRNRLKRQDFLLLDSFDSFFFF